MTTIMIYGRLVIRFNLSILECKSSSNIDGAYWQQVLIYPYWNVNQLMTAQRR